MKFALIIAGLLMPLVFNAAHAAGPAPITYSRANIVIVRALPPGGAAASDLLLDTEIRSAESTAAMPGWYNVATIGSNKAAMLVFSTPSVFQVNPGSDYAATDMLFLDLYGNIREIAPSVVTANLQETIISSEPVLAVMFLQGGMCEANNIRPGDVVRHTIFSKKPVVLTAPAPPDKTMVPSAAEEKKRSDQMMDQILKQNQVLPAPKP